MKKKFSERVEAIIDLTPPCTCLADVGCDHAQISIELKERGRVDRVIASDLREKPLKKARENVCKKGLTDDFQFRLCSGLSGYKEKEADVILISGMGGSLMRDILAEALLVAKSAKYLILEPQSDVEVLRSFLRKEGFKIENERFVREGVKYYPVLRGVSTGQPISCENVLFDKFGPILLTQKNALLRQYLEKKKEKYQEILSVGKSMEEQKEETEKRFQFLKTELTYLLQALEYYKEG